MHRTSAVRPLRRGCRAGDIGGGVRAGAPIAQRELTAPRRAAQHSPAGGTMNDPTRPAPQRRDWAHAWSALKDLIADPERTDRVFEIIRALSGDAFEHAWQRFRADPD